MMLSGLVCVVSGHRWSRIMLSRHAGGWVYQARTCYRCLVVDSRWYR